MGADHTNDTGGAFFRRVILACRNGRGVKIADSTGAALSGRDVLIRALVLRRLLRRLILTPAERHVGILLPPSAGAVVTNLALALDRRAPVNLNYTLSPETLNACLTQAAITHVVTSKRVVERLPVQLDAELILLEDLAPQATPRDKALAALHATATPVPVLLRLLGLDRIGADEVMSVVFTSGTTGTPKGAMLTYANIAANLAGVDHVIHWRPDDVVLGVLPFFHAFGSSITLWGPLTLGVTAVYAANPLEARTVGALCREHRATILAATPGFLRNYLRRTDPADFATLNLIAVGAERLPRQLSDECERTFGVRPIEGFGMTEMSPLVAANLPPSRTAGDSRRWHKEETVGRPVPGVRARIVDPETGADLPAGERGMLLVTGPNLMKGYLGQPEATAAAIRDGWYVTGDLATIDAEGFIRIVDRLSRFAKIAGEMVPHGAVEDALNAAIGGDETGAARIAVTSLPDPVKGERLVVLHTPLDRTPDDLRRGLTDAGLPNLFIPARANFVEVAELPLNGAGKIDLKRIKQLALDGTTRADDPSGDRNRTRDVVPSVAAAENTPGELLTSGA